jgi:hypothetical protein
VASFASIGSIGGAIANGCVGMAQRSAPDVQTASPVISG